MDPSIALLLQVVRSFAGAACLAITLISKFRYLVDPVHKKSYDLFDFPLMLEIELRPRFGMVPYLHPHGESFSHAKDILVRFIVTDKEYPGLPEVTHQSQHRRSFPALPRRECIDRRYPKNKSGCWRQLLEQKQQGHSHAGRFRHASVMKGK